MSEIKNEVAIKENNHAVYIEKNLDLIANQNGLSGNDLRNFAIQCKRTGLDPITRQIYAIPNKGKMTIMASVDGLRLIADRSGLYEGQTPAQWCGQDGVWVDVWLKKDPPSAARVGVHKSKFKEALYAIAIFDEYAKRNYSGQLEFMWAKMPSLMIAKVAESLALRKAFPNEMSGLYSDAEMDQSIQSKEANIAPNTDIHKPEPKNIVQKIVDKVQSVTDNKDIGDYVVKFGKKLSGLKLKDIEAGQLDSYLQYLDKAAATSGKPLTGDALELFNIGSQYLQNKYPKKIDESESMPF